ncbi:hypothetical protein [Listeria fleischmannii]|uniref:Uncharacterized protein n=1 Tax=Listeria fleischmannii FSL S10-1203 TaxID=1265822 RepID=W7DX54_9LIST|nr:hypothetical protein [Listeria fleischmannii]EUJ64826.1 hypothetical protein MCOL2_01465 [Listeria fleischmannii FSL S10-1203]
MIDDLKNVKFQLAILLVRIEKHSPIFAESIKEKIKKQTDLEMLLNDVKSYQLDYERKHLNHVKRVESGFNNLKEF